MADNDPADNGGDQWEREQFNNVWFAHKPALSAKEFKSKQKGFEFPALQRSAKTYSLQELTANYTPRSDIEPDNETVRKHKFDDYYVSQWYANEDVKTNTAGETQKTGNAQTNSIFVCDFCLAAARDERLETWTTVKYSTSRNSSRGHSPCPFQQFYPELVWIREQTVAGPVSMQTLGPTATSTLMQEFLADTIAPEDEEDLAARLAGNPVGFTIADGDLVMSKELVLPFVSGPNDLERLQAVCVNDGTLPEYLMVVSGCWIAGAELYKTEAYRGNGDIPAGWGVLHHPYICEAGAHIGCCRPSHLRIGPMSPTTAAAGDYNAAELEVRRAVVPDHLRWKVIPGSYLLPFKRVVVACQTHQLFLDHNADVDGIINDIDGGFELNEGDGGSPAPDADAKGNDGGASASLDGQVFPATTSTTGDDDPTTATTSVGAVSASASSQSSGNP